MTSAARVCTSEHWENCFSSRLIRRFVANHRDGPVPTRNSAGVHKISAHVPAHAAKSCYPGDLHPVAFQFEATRLVGVGEIRL